MSKPKQTKKPTRKTKKTSKIQIPKKYLSIAVVAFCIFVIGGGFYNLIESPLPMLSLQTGSSSLHPYLSDQTSTEGYLIMLVNAAMFVGFYMAYRSTQIAYDKVAANRWLMFGIGFILLGFSGNYLIMQAKLALLR